MVRWSYGGQKKESYDLSKIFLNSLGYLESVRILRARSE